jgi:hypothetical protein
MQLVHAADALAAPSEILSIVASWIVIRSALAGFFALLRKEPLARARQQAADIAFASLPSAVLVGIACVLYLLIRG